MSLNPITREEKFLAKAGGEDVGDLKPITRKEKFLDRIAGGVSGGAIAWADIKDKPFGEEVEDVTITFNGSPDGYEFNEPVAGRGAGWVKLSDLVPTEEQLIGGSLDSTYDTWDIENITSENLTIDDGGNISLSDKIQLFVVSDYNSANQYITSNGVWYYFARQNQGTQLELKYKTTTIKTLDEKFLPAGAGVLYVEVNLDEGTVLTPWETITNALEKNQDIIVKTSGRVYRLSNYDNGLIVLSCTIESMLYNLFVESNGECYSMDFQLQAELMM